MKIKLLACLLALSTMASAQIVAHGNNASGSSPSLNTTTATAIEVYELHNGSPDTPSDNQGNIYTLVRDQPVPGWPSTAAYITFAPTTSATTTWTVPNGDFFAVIAINGVAGVDQVVGSAVAGGTTNTFTITPTRNAELVISALTGIFAALPPTITPLTLLDNQQVISPAGSAWIADAWELQTTPTTVNGTWTFPGTPTSGGVHISFYSTTDPAPLVNTSTSLPEGFIGHAYAGQLTATGGVQRYNWTIASGSLPAGLSLSAAGAITGTPTGSASAPTLTFTNTDAQSHTVTTPSITLTVAATALSLTGSCPTGTQYVAYAGCTMSGTGGTAPLTYTWSGYVPWTGQNPYPNAGIYNAIAEGLTINTSTGAISGTPKGSGTYGTSMIVTDSLGAQASFPLTFTIQGESTKGGCDWPTDSFFHGVRVDSLPVDNNPEDQIWAPQLGPLQLGFGSTNQGIPFMKVPWNQPYVTVLAQVSDGIPGHLAPVPWDAPMEATRNGPGSCTPSSPCAPIGDYHDDNHVLILQTAGGGQGCAEYDLYDIYPNYTQPGTSYDVVSSGGTWGGGWFPDTIGGGYSDGSWNMTTSGTNGGLPYALLPQGYTAGDEGGLPILAYSPTVEEVIGTGSPSSPNGAVLHAIRFTENHTGNGHVWPTTHEAGLNSNCTGGTFVDPSGNGLITQVTIAGSGPGTGTPNTACTGVTGPVGEIYRLKASASIPSCISSSPQAAIIRTAMLRYGIMLADNGRSGTLTGVMDPRWNDADLACLTNISTADFEAVLTQPLAVNFQTSHQIITAGTGGTTTQGTTATGTTISQVTPSTVNMTVTVTDSTGTKTSQPFTLAVNPPPPPPLVITTLFLPSYTKAQPYLQPITATGGVPPYTFSLSGAPAGIAINSSTGMISGTP